MDQIVEKYGRCLVIKPGTEEEAVMFATFGRTMRFRDGRWEIDVSVPVWEDLEAFKEKARERFRRGG